MRPVCLGLLMLGLTFAQVIFTVPDNEGDAEMTVEYLYDGGDSITFTLTIDKEAWVGIGVSPRGRMENSDIMVGILGNTQSDYTVDDLGFSTGITMDAIDDVELLSFTQGDGRTEVMFRRPLVTGDVAEDRDISPTGDNLIVWAYGDTNTFEFHGSFRRGSFSLDIENNLVNGGEANSASSMSIVVTTCVVLIINLVTG